MARARASRSSSPSAGRTKKWVYRFGAGRNDGKASDRNLLGGKGVNLADMASIGLPVPAGFTITTEMCTAYYAAGKKYPASLAPQVTDGIRHIEKAVGARFGDVTNPLLVSVRSGARVSMPGMMDTVLNLGLNDDTVAGLAAQSGDERFAWDSYRRFVQMYASVVLDLSHHDFEDILERHKRESGVSIDADLSPAALRSIVAEYKDHVRRELNRPFPSDVHEQLWGAIGAVFDSWMTQRALVYRRIHSIPEEWGTAVNVQAMVFGNMGADSATGVAFTRDPSTGDNYFYGEFLVNAQGEDVVAGIRTPQPLSRHGKARDNNPLPCMEDVMPTVYRELDRVRTLLERHYRDIQDIEFTVQKGTLYMLQTRSGKRTAAAGLKIAVDMVGEKLLTREEALLRLDPTSLDQLLHPTLDPKAPRDVLGKGLPASPGAASGVLCFSADRAEDWAKNGQNVILARTETSPEDIHGMHAARGILTTRGGMTSHAAVVARGMGRPCVAGAGSLRIDYAAGTLSAMGRVFNEGDCVTIDGSSGEIMAGSIPTRAPELSTDFATIMGWADKVRRMKVRANAETPLDANAARRFGAEGIGLCRTEHMFFDPARIQHVREMIFARSREDREAALRHLQPAQRDDFIALFRIMNGLPVTIRLLDPPLHEFLPHSEAEIAAFASAAKLDAARVHERLADLHETNPMLGHRGCRLGMTYPEIYAMQIRAIFEAAHTVALQDKITVTPEIMIPLVVTRAELAFFRTMAADIAAECTAKYKRTLPYQLGTMIELPRAALMAGDIAGDAEFFSFGTNDLTQTTLGVSRDDAARFLPFYVERGYFARDPFVSIDVDGVGQLMGLACARGRATRPTLKLGICGEHGGDPSSIAFCEQLGLDYVSCSPYRVPIARLAAAQASLRARALTHKKKPTAKPKAKKTARSTVTSKTKSEPKQKTVLKATSKRAATPTARTKAQAARLRLRKAA